MAVEIDRDELSFTYSRSSGPGGQNVNRVETRVTLNFDLDASPSLTDAQKDRIRTRLAGRINKEGILSVSSQRHRAREANRRTAIERFDELIAKALERKRPRKPTKATAAARRRRLESKHRRGELKRTRGRGTGED